MNWGNSWILINCCFHGNQWTSNLALYLKMLVLVTAIDVPNFMLVSKSAQFGWNFELCRRTIYSSGKTNFRQINEWHINEDIYRPSRWQFSALQASSKHLGPQYWTWKTPEGRLLQVPQLLMYEFPTMWWEDKKWSLIGQVSKGEFGATSFSKMERKLWLAKQWKGMLFGCEQPFLWGERCETFQKNGCEGDYKISCTWRFQEPWVKFE